ncbi:hypothetical protein Cpap_1451 [Ruminiclostridium papyrosolvens DSM 2782]|uniref:Cyclic lactone autoinducer peptide n=1 Tax=Ruminiclostridium papyrosolvens DSM 2782 TaxID=588581 RepID=F1TE93_9FIRM|nr:cyclic lactone autoinducer peptide [Ruminiclostridium papyrosolvens]EGD47059.1 hypothetical protein Cpap_1451 [Ruminiclostridium papyrosolvens DSM 2782]WES36000.1 cyclic lactone autoinducer peptide [Ruminiclostridium papyrosolvens DSM 2782]WES36098.1 cyclic lactone autoinducer peptide [Ruminiclostridium papyrosolvens DSM 2782]
MDNTKKILSLIDSGVTKVAETKADNFCFLWGYQPKTPKALKKIKK